MDFWMTQGVSGIFARIAQAVRGSELAVLKVETRSFCIRTYTMHRFVHFPFTDFRKNSHDYVNQCAHESYRNQF